MSSDSQSWYYRSYLARATFGSVFIAGEYYAGAATLQYLGHTNADYYSLFIAAPFLVNVFDHMYAIYKPASYNGLKKENNITDVMSKWDMVFTVPVIIRSGHLAARYIQDKRISLKEKIGLVGHISLFNLASLCKFFCTRGSNAWVISSICQLFFMNLSVRPVYQTSSKISNNISDEISHRKLNIIDSALVVLICIKHYDSLSALPGAKIDKQNVMQLFDSKYNFDIIYNENDRFTKKELQFLLSKAQSQFKHGDYKSVIVVFSGHGNKDVLCLSDNTMNRVDIESYFSIENVKSNRKALRLYFIDSCRGKKQSILIRTDTYDTSIQMYKDVRSTRELNHPDENRCIFYSNTEPYCSYDLKNGGILIQALCKVLTDNKNLNLLQMQDSIREYAKNKKVPVYDDDGREQLASVLVEIKSTVNNVIAHKTVFRWNGSKEKNKIIAI